MYLNSPEVTDRALSILRSGENFQWSVITLLALVVYVYAREISQRNWRGVAAGLALYMVHWVVEIINAVIQHFTGHALWTVPTGTSFLLLVGVGIELSLMFSIAGLVLSKLLPEDPRLRILGINNRLLFAILNAAFFSLVEILLVMTPAFAWVYPWWGALPVFVTVYVPFFVVAFWIYDQTPRVQRTIIGWLFAANAVALVVLGAILRWI